MEYCPEIAVFQSAWQLIDKQTKGNLLSLNKEDCQLFISVIQTAVMEIVRGLEQDNSEKEAENWNQKLHVLCLYSVIVNKYRDPAKKQPDRVPVCSTVDVLAGMMPKFGSTFYFEMIKTCSWNQHFLLCLEYIDRDTALAIFNDYLQHSTCEPVDLHDTGVIPMVTDKILATCLNLPVAIETNISNLLAPVTKQKKFVQIMYPDVQSSDEEMLKKKEMIDHSQEITYPGEKLWDSVVGKYPKIIENVLDAFEKFVKQEEKVDADKHLLDQGQILAKLSKVFLYWYLYTLGTSKQEVYVEDDWFVKNLFVRQNPEVNSEPIAPDEIHLKYCINVSIVQKISDLEHRNRLKEIVRRSLELLYKHFRLGKQRIDVMASDRAKERSDMEGNEVCGQNIDKELIKLDSNGVLNNIEEDVCVLQTKTEHIFIKTEILLRMAEGSLNSESHGDKQVHLTGTHGDIGTEYSCCLLSSDWSRDVTLQSLLWRLENRLYKYESCLQTLLSETCWPFWKSKRVYEVMKNSTSLLTKKSHVLKCINVLEYLLNQQHGAPIHDMREIVRSAFCGMTTHDKDTFVAETYINRHVIMKKLLGLDTPHVFTRQIVNVFNKVTAEIDKQILDQIFLLCLMDPESVLASVLPWSLKSEDQAINLAKVFCSMSETCQTKHHEHHPDTCLLVTMIDRFLKSSKPSEKEEKHFVMFINYLMMATSKSCPLPPAEFMTTCLIDAIDSRNFRTNHHPIRCGFALSLLTQAIESGIKMDCDWLKNEFESALVVVSLTGILHECTEVWGEEVETMEISSEVQTVSMVTGYQKIDMKEKVLCCLHLVVDMVQGGYMKILDNESVYWLQAVTQDLNWAVRATLAKCLYKLGHIQEFAQWMELFDNLTTSISENLPSILLLCVIDARFIDELDTKNGDVTYIQYEDLITALVQIIPSLLLEEVQTLIDVLEMFIVKGIVSMYYRSTTLSSILLTDLTSVQPLLYLSQILRDVIITLSVVQGQKGSMLKHVMQNYSTVIKKRCSQSFQTEELQVFTLSQKFHHICGVMDTLPQDCVDSALVLLLHLLTEFKDITKVTTEVKVKTKQKDALKNGNNGLNSKMVKNIENTMRISVERLSDDFEEKQMLLKKLSES